MSISFLHVPTFSSSRVICILYVSFTFCRLVTKAPMLHVLQGVQNVSIEGQLLPGFVAALRPRTWNGNTRHRTRTLVRQRSILGRHLKGRIVDACLRSARFRICRLGAQGRAAAPSRQDFTTPPRSLRTGYRKILRLCGRGWLHVKGVSV